MFHTEMSRYECYAMVDAVKFCKILYFLDSNAGVWYIVVRQFNNQEVITIS